MESLRPQPPITADELRTWLEEGALKVSDATFEGILESLQPRRARLREAELSSRTAMIRGARMAFERQSGGMPVLPPEARPPRPIQIVTDATRLGPTRWPAAGTLGVAAVLAGGAFVFGGAGGLLAVVIVMFAAHRYFVRDASPAAQADADREFASKAKSVVKRGLLVWISAVFFLFAFMSTMNGFNVGTVLLGGVASALLFVALTGKGLSR